MQGICLYRGERKALTKETDLALLGRNKRTGRLKYKAKERMPLLAMPAYKELLSVTTTLAFPLLPADEEDECSRARCATGRALGARYTSE